MVVVKGMKKELIVPYHLVGTVKIRDKIEQFLVTFRKAGERQEMEISIKAKTTVSKQNSRQSGHYWRCNEWNAVENGIKLTEEMWKVRTTICYTEQEDEPVALKEMQKYKSLGGKRWTGFAMFTFYWRNAMWKTLRYGRKEHLLNPYSHLIYKISKQDEVTWGWVTKSDEERPDGKSSSPHYK